MVEIDAETKRDKGVKEKCKLLRSERYTGEENELYIDNLDTRCIVCGSEY
jgi:hypothetical protein